MNRICRISETFNNSNYLLFNFPQNFQFVFLNSEIKKASVLNLLQVNYSDGALSAETNKMIRHGKNIVLLYRLKS